MSSRNNSRANRDRPLSDIPPTGESTTRLRRASAAGDDLRESVNASIAAAIDDLESLELPRAAPTRASLEPPQQMPKGMPLLPFELTLPSKMPPLPSPPAPAALPSDPTPEASSSAVREVLGEAPRKSFSIALIVAVASLGVFLLVLALLWQAR
jgi:hypothetical protein